MKKHILIAFVFALFFSCTEVLEENEFLNADQSTLSDSLSFGNDFSANKGKEEYLGLHVTASELEVWKKRAVYGPYKTKGDFVFNSPGEWERLTDFAAKFRANPAADLWNGSANPEPHNKHHQLLSAAFVSLVKNDKALATLVKNQLLRQSRMVNPYKLTFITSEKGFHTANWYLRLLYAYDYVKHHCTASERQMLNNWFLNAGRFFANNTHETLKKAFPYRLSNNYSVRSGSAKNGGFNKGQFAFVNERGKNVNQIYWIHKVYNNRMASKVRFAGMVGIFLNNQSLIHHGKTYVKEFLKYGVFPDGTMGEYERNGNYGSPQTGALYYGSINIEVAINLADALARKGDFDLYNYTTSEGIYGTQGGQKNIRLLIDTYLENMTGKVKRYHKAVSRANLIDCNDERQERKNIAFDIVFSQANWYYQDGYAEQCYLRKNATASKYPGAKYWSSVQLYWPWSGATGTIPSYPFMFAGIDTSKSGGSSLF